LFFDCVGLDHENTRDAIGRFSVNLLAGGAVETLLYKKPWHVLGFLDGENADLEKICEYNINQLEEIDSTFSG
jgi:hypothetical protein